MTEVANAAEIENWNEQVGKTWAQLHGRLDRQIAPIGRAAMARAGLEPGLRVLDVGCGCGETSIDIAGQVAPGQVLGLDVSALLLGIARDAAQGIANLQFEQGDAQVRPFEPDFDRLFSRFGVMFFEDPAAAFANLRTALKPDGRLAFCCWRAPQENPWLWTPLQAAAHLLPPLPPSDPTDPGPFAFADRGRVRRILQGAGFAEVAIEPFDMQMATDSLEDAVGQAFRMGPLGSALRRSEADEATKRKVEAALREALAKHVADGVVRLAAAAWIVSARRG
jgi:SAM-dependent methyltransferase